MITGRAGKPSRVPRITGRIRRRHSIEVRDVEFLRANTDRTIKITLPGPFTMSRQAKNEFFDNEEELVMDRAAAVNEEAHDLERAFAGVPGIKALHMCFGYAQLVHDKSRGRYAFLEPLADCSADQISIEAAQPRLDLGDPAVETPAQVAARIRKGLEHPPAERLIPAPDSGMKYLPRASAFGKLQALAKGAAIVRRELM